MYGNVLAPDNLMWHDNCLICLSRLSHLALIGPGLTAGFLCSLHHPASLFKFCFSCDVLKLVPCFCVRCHYVRGLVIVVVIMVGGGGGGGGFVAVVVVVVVVVLVVVVVAVVDVVVAAVIVPDVAAADCCCQSLSFWLLFHYFVGFT